MPALAATNLGKAYRTYRRPIDSLKELVFRRNYAETFWAIRGVNLEVPAGGSLGIVGDNGAGKTTLLKLLTGATAASEGAVQRHGRASAILSLGAGFHADLTGRENIRIGCAVLGLTPHETDELLPGVIDFSELGEFVERPLKTYSSGMYLRLAFSVATAIDPDILIVDEHLAVGDQHFRHKCLRRIMALREQGCALVLCSHDMYSVGEVCDRALWVRDGRVSMLGPTADVLNVYQDYVRQRESMEEPPVRGPSADPPPVPTSDVHLQEIEIRGIDENGVVRTGERLEVAITAHLTDSAVRDGVHIALVIVRNDGTWCYGVTSHQDANSPPLTSTADGQFGIRFVLDSVALLSGIYGLTVALMDNRSPHCFDYRLNAAPFVVRHDSQEKGLVRLAHQWLSPD